jgi:predicted lipid carrier protein YhbT
MDHASGKTDFCEPTAKGAIPSLLAKTMGVLPLAPLEVLIGSAMKTVLQKNPAMFSRLGKYANTRFAIDPVDCPFAILLEPRPVAPRVSAVRALDESLWDARIAGNLVVLLGLLEGMYDGDALFFTRDLTIEGDTSAVLALRNAIEDAELDMSDILGLPAVLARPASIGLGGLSHLLRTLLGAPSFNSPGRAARSEVQKIRGVA